jgi:hypothetical protein
MALEMGGRRVPPATRVDQVGEAAYIAKVAGRAKGARR